MTALVTTTELVTTTIFVAMEVFVTARLLVTVTVLVPMTVMATAGRTTFVDPIALVTLTIFVTTEIAFVNGGSGGGKPAGSAGNEPGPVGKVPCTPPRRLLVGGSVTISPASSK